MNNILFSIILPVYNGENFIARAIESVLNQTFENFELLIIDDGSIDDSLEICNSFRLEDSRITIISKINTGVSNSRNIGLNNSRGDYILFLDADDFLAPDCLEQVYKTIKSIDADLYIFNYNDVKLNSVKEARKIDVSLAGDEIISISEVINASVRQYQWKEKLWYGNLRTVWGKCFIREKILFNNIFFNEELKIGEDMVFLLKYIFCSHRISFSNVPIYNYCCNTNSVMNNRKWNGIKQGKQYFNCVEKIIGNLLEEEAKADLWLETAEADWKTIIESSLSLYEKYKIFNSIIRDDNYIRFSKKGINLNFKEKCYGFLIRHHLIILLMFVNYFRVMKYQNKFISS